MYDLEPIYTNQKSFYNKAKVVDGKLYSYNTLVAEVKYGLAYVYNVQSATTVRHVKEFLLQNGFEATTKKQIMKDYMF